MAFAGNEASSSTHPSSASPRSSWTYHVFLSFRGEDTRTGFTDHLYAALNRKGITTFRDDKNLERGEVISQELLKAIEESIIAITVLSPKYASSSWCLDELQKIIDCKNKLGLSIVPIFYGVEPADVRYQKGTFAEAFRKHEERFGQNSEKVERWRDALSEVARHSGWDSKNQREAELVENIAQHIHTKLIPRLPYFLENTVGLASKVEEVNSLIGLGSDDVRFIGLWGMGGIGKTTLARAAYEVNKGEFQNSCFLVNVREGSEKNGLVHIQEQLLSRMNISKGGFYNLYDGQMLIRTSLSNKKVLLVLDDVSEISQLENLAGKQDWFGPGSRVIITTRDMHLLRVHGVLQERIYKVEVLLKNEALHLFSLKAFKQDQPEEGYLDLSQEVVKYTSGLPLALVVLGSYLNGRTIDIWHSAIKKIKSIPDAKIIDTLRLSYDSLDSIQRNIFLDVACFFNGKNKDEVIRLLENCGYNSKIEIDVLIERSLVKVTLDWQGKDRLEVHDLLQEMGRNIVIQESPNDPGKRTRLWSAEDIEQVLYKDKGNEAIQSIVVNYGHSYRRKGRIGDFSKLSQLKLLCSSDVDHSFSLNNNFPNSLKVLHLNHFPSKTLSLTDERYEVVEIKLPCSKIEQLWEGTKFLDKLKYLDLSFSDQLKRTPDFSAVPILETLVLHYCTRLSEVHPSLVCHKNLIVLNLGYCRSLETLPGKFLEMSSLEVLILSNCYRLKKLPEFGECMIHLSNLSLRSTAIRKLPASLVHYPDASPTCVSSLPFLTDLDLSYCKLSNESVPEFCHLPSLKELNLSGNNFVRVPITSTHKLPNLRSLRLISCTNLEVFPEFPSSLIELRAWKCPSLSISKFNLSSKIWNLFASHRRDGGEVFNMLISEGRIPSWFTHRVPGDSISVPQLDCPQNERLVIFLCFKIQYGVTTHTPGNRLSLLNGNRVITTMTIHDIQDAGIYVYFVYLTSDKIHQDNQFRLFISDPNPSRVHVLSSFAHSVRNQDLEDFNKSYDQM